jgi:hypothetical protein
MLGLFVIVRPSLPETPNVCTVPVILILCKYSCKAFGSTLFNISEWIADVITYILSDEMRILSWITSKDLKGNIHGSLECIIPPFAWRLVKTMGHLPRQNLNHLGYLPNVNSRIILLLPVPAWDGWRCQMNPSYCIKILPLISTYVGVTFMCRCWQTLVSTSTQAEC